MIRLGKYALGWKVVRIKPSGQRTSLFVEDDKWRVYYKKYRWAKGRSGTLLFCFETLKEAAQKYPWYPSEVEFWLCLMKNPRPVFTLCTVIDSQKFEQFWFGNQNDELSKLLLDVSSDKFVGAEKTMLLFRVGHRRTIPILEKRNFIQNSFILKWFIRKLRFERL